MLIEENTSKVMSNFEVLLGNKIISRDFGKYESTIYDSGIHHFILRDGETLTIKDMQKHRKWMEGLGDKKYLNLIEGGVRSEITDDAKASSADNSENLFTVADAILVKGVSQRIMANFYLRFNKPAKPTQVFTERESAVFWLMSFV